MSSKTQQAQTPDWLLERLLLGELPPRELVRLQSQIEKEPGLKERLDALKASNAAVIEQYPVGETATAIKERFRRAQAQEDHRAHQAKAGSGWYWMPAVAAVATVLIVAWVALPGHVEHQAGSTAGMYPNSEGPERIKGSGDPRLVVHRKNKGGAHEVLNADISVKEGDVLQLKYIAGAHRSGVIVSVDGRGEVTLHFPDDAQGSTKLESGGVLLAHAYELDDAPEFERFFFVSSAQQVAANDVLKAVRVLAKGANAERAALKLPNAAWKMDSIVLRKKAP